MVKIDEKKILDAFDAGVLYTIAKEYQGSPFRLAFPRPKEWDPTCEKERDEAERIARYIDNGTVVFYDTFVEVWECFICPASHDIRKVHNWKSGVNAIYYIIDGAIESRNSLCERCQHFLKQMVGECDKRLFKEISSVTMPEYGRKEAFGQLIKIKRGYVKEYEFSEDMIFTKGNIQEQIMHFKSKGAKAKERNAMRKQICLGDHCLKYRTAVCQKGWREYNDFQHCFINAEMMERTVRPLIQKEFGSERNAYWYFSQCGTRINFDDPITKRRSERLLSVPASRPSEEQATGFFMAYERYPYALGDYHKQVRINYRSESQTTRNTRHEAFISKKEFKQKYGKLQDKTRYDPTMHKDVLYAIYALYRLMDITPGRFRRIQYMLRAYDIAVSIAGTQGKYLYGNSQANFVASIESYESIFNCMDIDAKKLENVEEQDKIRR